MPPKTGARRTPAKAAAVHATPAAPADQRPAAADRKDAPEEALSDAAVDGSADAVDAADAADVVDAADALEATDAADAADAADDGPDDAAADARHLDDLATLPGLGPKLHARAVRVLGSEDALRAALEGGDVERLAAVQGIGEQRARTLVQAARGDEAGGFFGSPRAEEVFARVRERIVERACTKAGRNAVRLLSPLDDPAQRAKRLGEALVAAAEVDGLDLAEARRHLARLAPLPERGDHAEATFAIFIDEADDEEALEAAGLTRHALVTSARDVDTAQGVDAGIYAYRHGDAPVADADHIVSVPFSTKAADVAPWSVVARARKARPILEAVAALSALRGRPGVAAEALAVADAVPLAPPTLDASSVAMVAEEALAAAKQAAEQALEQVTVTGAELLRSLGSEPPESIRRVYREALAEAGRSVRDRTGLDVDPFSPSFPPRVDLEAIEAAVDAARRGGAGARMEAMQQAARRLVTLLDAVEKEIDDHVAFDARQAIGDFVRTYRLTAPQWGEGLLIEGALHFDHAPGGDPVDYRLGLDADGGPDDSRLALLTGANSGGKTTLLETVVQVLALAHAGLPVNATRAVVPSLDAVHLHAERRSLGAGAFEAFLRRFFPVVGAPGRVFVLADELEAMTELEAAAQIIAAFLERLATRDAFALMATHMANHVLPAVREEARAAVRVDGIEARGLDAAGRLVVERSPRLGHHARSTPELILRRLAQKGPRDLRDIFAELAERVAPQ